MGGGVQLKLIQLGSKRVQICRNLPKSTTFHSNSNSRSNRNRIACMKWYKKLSFLTCCFLTHSNDETLYQLSLSRWRQYKSPTIYSGESHYHASSIHESSSKKAGSSKSWQACGHGWTCSNFPWQQGSIPMHQSRSNMTGHELQGFYPKPMN